QAVVESVVASAARWQGERVDEELVDVLQVVTRPFLALWVEHSQSLQISPVEALSTEEERNGLRAFIRKYGRDIFHAKFLTLGNLRGVLHGGIDAFLDYLRDNADPLHPVLLLDDLDHAIPRREAVRHLQYVLQCLVDNYEEYKDYNTTTTQSDYGDNLHLLLDFLRLKASYDRRAWQLRPLVLAHEVLADTGWDQAALLWERAFREM